MKYACLFCTLLPHDNRFISHLFSCNNNNNRKKKKKKKKKKKNLFYIAPHQQLYQLLSGAVQINKCNKTHQSVT